MHKGSELILNLDLQNLDSDWTQLIASYCICSEYSQIHFQVKSLAFSGAIFELMRFKLKRWSMGRM